MHSTPAPRVAITLALIGLTCVGVRYHFRYVAAVHPADTVWRLTYTIECESDRGLAHLAVAVPHDTPQAHVVRQDMRAVNFQIAPLSPAPPSSRKLNAIAETTGESRLQLQFDIRLSPRTAGPSRDRLVTGSAKTINGMLRSADGIQVESPVVAEELNQLRKGATNPPELVQRIFNFCHTLVPAGESAVSDDAEGTLVEHQGSPLGQARAMIALCRAAGMPACLTTGFELRDVNRANPSDWVEVLLEGRWVPFDPAHGWQGELPHHYLPVCRSDPNIVVAQNTRGSEIEFSLQQLPTGSGLASFRRGSLTEVLDLTRLPLEMHPMLSLILLMPFGALLTCLFRNLIGVKTSGTFTPTLLAMCFVFADWRPGVIVLIAVVILGFVTRNLLDSLQLLMLPRLSIVLTLIVCCIVFGVSLSHYLRLAPAAGAVFLPLVILTMIVERFYVTTQEDGAAVALQYLAGTLLVGACCYLVLRWETIARWVLTYPEVHFCTAAVLVLVGRYTGYQLLELWRFRQLVDHRP